MNWMDMLTTTRFAHVFPQITFNMLMKQFISLDSGSAESQNLLKSYSHFMAGLFSLPIRLPGTTYSKCLKV